MRRRLLPFLIIALLALLALPSLVQAMTFDQAVSTLISSGYASKMEDKCVSFQGNSLGFRSAGTAADDACARWIAREMKAIGLSDVTLEAVPVDEWDFKSASVQVSGLGYSNPVTYKATGFGGGVSTPFAGVTGDIVYVKDVDLVNGPWSGSAGAFDAVGDVTGKIVLVDFESAMWWMGMPNMEAGLRGAAAVILTYNPNWPGYFGQEDALGAFDAETDLSAPPMVWIPWKSGDALKDALEVGAVSATVKLDAPLTLIADGGEGYNVVGRIRGSTNKNEYVIFGGHHDAWFQGGLDNASSVVSSLVIAKAIKMSRFQPKRTMVFLSTTAEEYGLTNSWYDWCIGAWSFITQEHPSWAGRIAAMLNTEIAGYEDGNLWMLASPELGPMLEAELDASSDLVLTRNDIEPAVIGQPWCWNDQWTFTAAGVPSISFWSQDNAYSGTYKTTIYHTQYDTPALIDWTFFGDMAKFQFRVAQRFDRGLLPYRLSAHVEWMSGALDAQIGVDDEGNPAPPTVAQVMVSTVGEDLSDDLVVAAERFARACEHFDAAAAEGKLPAANLPAINAQLMQIEKLLNSSFTALDWLDNTTYPFDQITRDIYRMVTAYEALDPETPDYDTAATAIASTGLMWYGTNFSPGVFKKVLQQHRQSYYHIAWGGQGHLEKYQNLQPEYDDILGKRQATARESLAPHIAAQVKDLQARVIAMTAVFDEAADQIEDLIPPQRER